MRFDVTRHLGSYSVKPSAPPYISACFVSCAFSKATSELLGMFILCDPRGCRPLSRLAGSSRACRTKYVF